MHGFYMSQLFTSYEMRIFRSQIKRDEIICIMQYYKE